MFTYFNAKRFSFLISFDYTKY